MNAERINGEPGCGGYTAAMTGASPRSSFLVRAEDCRRMRWKNGAGWTSEILRVPDVEDWRWRLSIAEVETDAPFSPFPGVERELVLLGGGAQDAGPLIRALVEKLDAPAIMTVNARGVLAPDHPLGIPASPSMPPVKSVAVSAYRPR